MLSILKASTSLPLRNRLAYGDRFAVSIAPARSLGLSDRGELRVGLRADVVVLDEELKVRQVYVGGRSVAL